MSALRFRQYAEDCRRSAERLPPDQRPKMLEIAKAWEACAKMIEDEEKKDDDPGPHRSIEQSAKILAAVARRQRHATAATTKDVRPPSCA